MSTDRRHAYWIKPGLLRNLHGQVIAVTFGIGRVWVRSTVGRGRGVDLYWPRWRRIGG